MYCCTPLTFNIIPLSNSDDIMTQINFITTIEKYSRVPMLNVVQLSTIFQQNDCVSKNNKNKMC